MKRALLLSAFVLASSCGGDFDPSSRITTLRVIAVGAKKKVGTTIDPKGASWAHPGDTVEISTLWDDPLNRDTTWAWITCELPTSSTVLGCFQKFAKDAAAASAAGRPIIPTIGPKAPRDKTLDHFEVKVRPDIFTNPAVPPEGRAGATIGVILIACPGVLQVVQQQTKTDLPVACLDQDDNRLGPDQWIAGIKRIFVREKDENADPVIKGITYDGVDWPEGEVREFGSSCAGDENRFDRCGDDGKHGVGVDIDPSSFEVGTDEFGIPFTEQVIVQYYATEGLFEYDVKRGQDPNTRFAGRSGKGGDHTMWFVVRDNRGGVAWVERKIRIK
ncbi:MAG: hypothetical protein ACXVEF_11975 [Polyangiales bacterium]